MNDQIKKLVITAFTLAALIFAVGANYYRILYMADWVRSYCIEIVERLLPRMDTFTTIDPDRFRRFIFTYENFPGSFSHSGGLLVCRPEKDVDLDDLAENMIGYTDYYRLSALKNDLKKINPVSGGEISANTPVIIPGSLPPVMEDMRRTKKPPVIKVRGLYFSGQTAGSSRLLENLPGYRALGINAIVFDVKDVTGIVNYRSGVKEVVEYNTHRQRTIDNIRKLIRELRKNGIQSIARMAVFQDRLLAKNDGRLAIGSKSRGGIWRASGGDLWCDPTDRRVQDYNIKIASELADMGVDEIQFDYIRFPTEGNLSDALFDYDFGRMSNVDVITSFLKRAYREVSSRNALLSIDIFGVVAWGKEVDIRNTGQRIEHLSKYCDVISPMLYPSHFNDDFDGYRNPGDNPYYFINKGCQKVLALSDKKTAIRPWLQAFRWRVSRYNEKYIADQVRASDDSGAKGYLFWSASNDYRVVLSAMKDLVDKDAGTGSAGGR
ncbi:MAG: putative glycoside hydrolase [Spirochaetes bacterium]|nr:putative glycoside hydrolase [Spirochaetota bacterium]